MAVIYLLGLRVPSLAAGAGKAWAVTIASEDCRGRKKDLSDLKKK